MVAAALKTTGRLCWQASAVWIRSRSAGHNPGKSAHTQDTPSSVQPDQQSPTISLCDQNKRQFLKLLLFTAELPVNHHVWFFLQYQSDSVMFVWTSWKLCRQKLLTARSHYLTADKQTKLWILCIWLCEYWPMINTFEFWTFEKLLDFLQSVWTASPRFVAPCCAPDPPLWLTAPWTWPAAICSAWTWRNGRFDRGRNLLRRWTRSDDRWLLLHVQDKEIVNRILSENTRTFCYKWHAALKVKWSVTFGPESSSLQKTHLPGIEHISGRRLWTRFPPWLLTRWCSVEFGRKQNCLSVLNTLRNRAVSPCEWCLMLKATKVQTFRTFMYKLDQFRVHDGMLHCEKIFMSVSSAVKTCELLRKT